jgi:DNA-directed RNA polymerase subunit RPC12/RpoP
MISYRCSHCRGVVELDTDGERSIQIGCPDCGEPTEHDRVYTCVSCGTDTTDPQWPKDMQAPEEPHCLRCYGRMVIDQ